MLVLCWMLPTPPPPPGAFRPFGAADSIGDAVAAVVVSDSGDGGHRDDVDEPIGDPLNK